MLRSYVGVCSTPNVFFTLALKAGLRGWSFGKGQRVVGCFCQHYFGVQSVPWQLNWNLGGSKKIFTGGASG